MLYKVNGPCGPTGQDQTCDVTKGGGGNMSVRGHGHKSIRYCYSTCISGKMCLVSFI